MRRVALLAASVTLLFADGARAAFEVAPGAPYTGNGDVSGSIDAGDLDGDGSPDLVIGNASDPGTVSALVNDGAGAFAKPPGAPFPTTAATNNDVELGDLDGDGDLDAVTANNLTGTAADDGLVSVLLGDGTGVLTDTATFPSGGDRAIALRLAELTGDATADLAVLDRTTGADAAPGAVAVLAGNGDGTFAAPVTAAAVTDGNALVAADLDGDGAADLAVATEAGDVVVLLRQGDGSFTASTTAAGLTTLRGIAAGDVDGDGDADLAVTSREGAAPPPGQAVVLLNDGSGALTPGAPIATGGPSARGILITDLTGDGDADLAVTHAAIPGTVGVLAGDGAGGFAPADGSPYDTSIVEQAVALTSADFDADGLPDLATAHAEFAARVVVLRNTGFATEEPPGKPCRKHHHRKHHKKHHHHHHHGDRRH